MSLPFVIVYQQQSEFPFGFHLIVGRENERLFFVMLEASEDVKDGLVAEADRLRIPEELLQRTIIRWAVRETEERLRDGLFSGIEKDEFVKLPISDPNTVLRLAADKTCDYQFKRGRDLFCLAGNPRFNLDSIQVESGRPFTPTSRTLCRACELPDTDFLCSHLIHPTIGALSSVERYQLTVFSALCDRGRQEVGSGSRQGSMCHAGGNSCWQRIVEPEARAALPRYVSPMLTSAIDHLSAVWKLTFGRHAILFRLRSATSTAALESPCSTREEFQSRMSDLADVLKLMQVPHDPSQDENIPADQTLKRLAACLNNTLEADEMMRVNRALEALAAINEARTALQHTATKANLVAAFNKLGIGLPSADWGARWDVVRSATTHAFSVIATELNRHT